MDKGIKRKLTLATIVYWFLLLYILGALIWWLVLLQQQNEQIVNLKLEQLNHVVDSVAKPIDYLQKTQVILEEKYANTTKYLSEGITFLALIIVGAIFVYRAVRRQL